MLYKITKAEDTSAISPVERTTLETESLYEVKDLSQWLASTPKLLSKELGSPVPPLLVGCEVTISPEFRVDVLGIDPDGTLVVCEVKRDASDPLYQALQYCGRIYSMPTDDLIDLVENRAAQDIKDLQAKLDMPEGSTLRDVWEPQRRSLRLVIVAEDFPAHVFQAARWLVSNGVALSCVRFDCFKQANDVFLLPQQVLPSVETAENYAIQRETQQRQAQVRTRNMFYSLIGDGLLQKGERVLSHEKKEIGIVREDHIERLADGAKCVNCDQLTGISGFWSVGVMREGKFMSLGDLRQETTQTPIGVESTGDGVEHPMTQESP